MTKIMMEETITLAMLVRNLSNVSDTNAPLISLENAGNQ
jgi:hypothetical protein